ncbi:MAG: hypothetical protein JOZ23_02135 [Mycobacterium sp.]|nr:hypothetical protein [Mycobacterium sp.]MBV9350323.1 hypothetical protein [Mycobacterium sp.]
MSWLLVALVPALLMLATFGLGRLETALVRDTVTPTDITQFLEQAHAADVRTLAQSGMPEALDHMHRGRTGRIVDAPARKPNSADHQADPFLQVAFAGTVQPGVRSGRRQHSRANPQFTASWRIDRV